MRARGEREKRPGPCRAKRDRHSQNRRKSRAVAPECRQVTQHEHQRNEPHAERHHRRLGADRGKYQRTSPEEDATPTERAALGGADKGRRRRWNTNTANRHRQGYAQAWIRSPPRHSPRCSSLQFAAPHALLASDDARLAPDSGYWHRVDGVGAPCKLCLAGTVIHALAPAMVDNTLTPNSFPESWTRALCAVNAVRLGQWSVAANFVHMHRVRRGGRAESRHRVLAPHARGRGHGPAGAFELARAHGVRRARAPP